VIASTHIILVFKLINHLKVKVLGTCNVKIEVVLFALNRLITDLC